MNTIKICTSHVYPQIPTHRFDWCAWYDSDGEELRHYGHGATEAEAIVDLVQNYVPQSADEYDPRDLIGVPESISQTV